MQQTSTISTLTTADFNETLCAASEVYTPMRFAGITLACIMALAGTFGNLLLVVIFAIRRFPNTPPTLYPLVLAVLDFLMCFLYIAIFGADAVIMYLKVEEFFEVYFCYIIPMFAVSRMVQMAIPYMLIFGTLERLVWIAGNMRGAIVRRVYSVRGRYVTMAVAIIMCIALRMPVFWASVIIEYPKCHDYLRSKVVDAADWVKESAFYHLYDLHFIVFVQTFTPFFALVILNLIIVRVLASEKPAQNGAAAPVNEKLLPSPTADNEKNGDHPQPKRSTSAMQITLQPLRSMSGPMRNAVYTMVAIVSSYLLCNTLHLILTVLEKMEADILKNHEDPNVASIFHSVFSDVVSFCYMFTSAIRILIYMVCNPLIRKDLLAICHRSKKLPLEAEAARV